MIDQLPPGFQRFGAELCEKFMSALPISGIAVSAFPGHAPETSICASDTTAARIDELQFDLGEGPRWQALQTRRPVMLPHVKSNGHSGWPVFSKAILDYDVAAIYVFPLQLGAMDVGVIELYSTTPGSLSHGDYSMALQLADTAAWQMLRHILTAAPGDNADTIDPDRDKSPLSRREVHQATGMVLAQAGTSATDALLLLRAHAFSQGLTVREVSRDVVNKKINFTPKGGDDATASVE